MNKKMQLFIFPYAGGSKAAFKRLTDLIDERIDVITVEYAGRGTRAKEPQANSIGDLLDDAISYCLRQRDESVPFSVMGYSMGSILAYEMLIRNPLPGKLDHLFISAEVSPKYRSYELQKVVNPSEDILLDRARILGGLNEQMLDNKRFIDIYIKPMLSDYKLFYEYRFTECNEKIDVDTTFFYCEKDTAFDEVKKWSELIEGEFDFHELGENHFFINQHYKEMASIINTTLVNK